jgi:hypothetical protein
MLSSPLCDLAPELQTSEISEGFMKHPVRYLTILYTCPRVTIILFCWLAILTHTSWLSSFSRMTVSTPHLRSIFPKPQTILSHTTLNSLAGVGFVWGDGTTSTFVFWNRYIIFLQQMINLRFVVFTVLMMIKMKSTLLMTVCYNKHDYYLEHCPFWEIRSSEI